jgi:hypothetical protein
MTHSRYTLVLGSVVAASTALLLTACGNSTSPKGESPAQVAAYYDALAGTDLAAGTGPDSLDAEFIGVLEGPIAYGQLPTKINITAGGALTWYANAAIFVDSGQTDSVTLVSLWADTVVSSFIFSEAEKTTLPALEAAEFYNAAGDGSIADSSTVTVAWAVKSGSCATNITITHVYAAFPTYDPANTTCTPAIVTVGGHLHFEAASGIAAQFEDIDLTSTAVSAVRLQATHGADFARIRSRPRGTLLRFGTKLGP